MKEKRVINRECLKKLQAIEEYLWDNYLTWERQIFNKWEERSNCAKKVIKN